MEKEKEWYSYCFHELLCQEAELLHKAGEILQTRHIPQSLSRGLKHKAADTTLDKEGTNPPLARHQGGERATPEFLSFSSLPWASAGDHCESRDAALVGPRREFKPALLLSLAEDAPQRVKSYWAVMLSWCHMVLIISLLPRQLQQRHLHAQPLPAASAQGQTWAYLTARNTTPGIQRGKCPTLTPLPCQGNRCCHQKLAATPQANINAIKICYPRLELFFQSPGSQNIG